jgi:hypothetical protein
MVNPTGSFFMVMGSGKYSLDQMMNKPAWDVTEHHRKLTERFTP